MNNHLPEMIFAMTVVGFVGVGSITLIRAWAQRISRGAGPDHREVDALRDEVEALRAEQDGMRDRLTQLDEIQNRLDFAERMLAQGKDKPALPGPR